MAVAAEPSASTRDVGAAAGGRDDAVGVGEHHLAPSSAARCRAAGGGIDGDDLGAEGDADHHGGQAHPAAPEDGQPLPRLQASLRGEGVVGGGEAAAQRGCGDEVDVVGQPDEVEVGRPHRHLLGERAGMGEAGLGLLGAHLCLARSGTTRSVRSR